MQPCRYNIYTLIHKALRNSMCETLCGLGSVDDTDNQATEAQLLKVEALLELCQGHLEHENQFIHQAIALKNPNLQLSTAQDHLDHEYAIRKLTALVGQIRQLSPANRPAALLQLYRELALFIAHNLEHMQEEEIHNAQILWDLFSDEEIHQIEQQLVESIEPVQRMYITLMMLASVNVSERHQLVAGMRQQMPETIFNELLIQLKTQLKNSDWQKLSDSLATAA